MQYVFMTLYKNVVELLRYDSGKRDDRNWRHRVICIYWYTFHKCIACFSKLVCWKSDSACTQILFPIVTMQLDCHYSTREKGDWFVRFGGNCAAAHLNKQSGLLFVLSFCLSEYQNVQKDEGLYQNLYPTTNYYAVACAWNNIKDSSSCLPQKRNNSHTYRGHCIHEQEEIRFSTLYLYR